jgi:hypothetical protein
MGGLGLLNTKKMNIALLTKWIWRLYQDEDNIWSRVIRAKYPDANNLLQGSGQGGSQVWKNLHKIKHYFAMGAKFLVRDGGRTRFWLDWWIGDAPLQASFPSLFAICDSPEALVSQVCQPDALVVRFRRSLDQAGLAQWQELVSMLDEVNLNTGADQVTWHLEASGVFSVKSMYAKLSQGATMAHYKDVWAAVAVPLKINFFPGN